MQLSLHEESQLYEDFSQVQALLQCGVFAPNAAGSPLFKSAFINVMIYLRDIAAKLGKENRISFADDVLPTENTNQKTKHSNKVSDITDLIIYMRNAVCHQDSVNNEYLNNYISFNVAFGKCAFMQIDDTLIDSDYEDDICFFFGIQKIYLKRHIIRFFTEARAVCIDKGLLIY